MSMRSPEQLSLQQLFPALSRRSALAEAMGHVGIGKAWRKRVKKMRSMTELANFEEYVLKRARSGDAQWADAWDRFTVWRVANELINS